MDKILWILVGDRHSQRSTEFRQQLVTSGFNSCFELDYTRAISEFDEQNTELEKYISSAGSKFSKIRIRFDALGQNPYLITQLIVQGRREKTENFSDVLELVSKGGVFNFTHWFSGVKNILFKLSDYLTGLGELYGLSVSFVNGASDIVSLYDKYQSQQQIKKNGIATPALLGKVHSFEYLLELMSEKRCFRVFVKSNYGSCASGIAALQWSRKRGKFKLVTTSRLLNNKLYNSLKPISYTDKNDIKSVIDILALSNIYAELWVPKPTLNGLNYDLRIISDKNGYMETVARLSRSPFTNLHLGNEKRLLHFDKPGNKEQQSISHTISKLHELYPDLFYFGVDLTIPCGSTQACVFEINAFGDQVTGLNRQPDIYRSQILQSNNHVDHLVGLTA